jgi:hypothetical protein
VRILSIGPEKLKILDLLLVGFDMALNKKIKEFSSPFLSAGKTLLTLKA